MENLAGSVGGFIAFIVGNTVPSAVVREPQSSQTGFDKVLGWDITARVDMTKLPTAFISNIQRGYLK